MPITRIAGALVFMGAKYVPSIKDLKANLRFHKSQRAAAQARKARGMLAHAKPKGK